MSLVVLPKLRPEVHITDTYSYNESHKKVEGRRRVPKESHRRSHTERASRVFAARAEPRLRSHHEKDGGMPARVVHPIPRYHHRGESILPPLRRALSFLFFYKTLTAAGLWSSSGACAFLTRRFTLFYSCSSSSSHTFFLIHHPPSSHSLFRERSVRVRRRITWCTPFFRVDQSSFLHCQCPFGLF